MARKESISMATNSIIVEIAFLVLIFVVGWGIGWVIHRFQKALFIINIALIIILFLIKNAGLMGYQGGMPMSWPGIEGFFDRLIGQLLRLDTLQLLALFSGMLKGMNVFPDIRNMLSKK